MLRPPIPVTRDADIVQDYPTLYLLAPSPDVSLLCCQAVQSVAKVHIFYCPFSFGSDPAQILLPRHVDKIGRKIKTEV